MADTTLTFAIEHSIPNLTSNTDEEMLDATRMIVRNYIRDYLRKPILKEMKQSWNSLTRVRKDKVLEKADQVWLELSDEGKAFVMQEIRDDVERTMSQLGLDLHVSLYREVTDEHR